jgi:hypothetical protein
MPGETYVFSSGTQLDNGVAIPAGQVVPPVTKNMWYGGLTGSTIPASLAARTLFTPEGSASYQVVAVTEIHNVVGSATFMLVQASGTVPVGSGVPLLNSGMNAYSAVNTPQYGNLINSAALQTVAPGNTLGVRYTASATEPEGQFEVVLQRIG